jgi:hypothetical protein
MPEIKNNISVNCIGVGKVLLRFKNVSPTSRLRLLVPRTNLFGRIRVTRCCLDQVLAGDDVHEELGVCTGTGKIIANRGDFVNLRGNLWNLKKTHGCCCRN